MESRLISSKSRSIIRIDLSFRASSWTWCSSSWRRGASRPRCLRCSLIALWTWHRSSNNYKLNCKRCLHFTTSLVLLATIKHPYPIQFYLLLQCQHLHQTTNFLLSGTTSPSTNKFSSNRSIKSYNSSKSNMNNRNQEVNPMTSATLTTQILIIPLCMLSLQRKQLGIEPQRLDEAHHLQRRWSSQESRRRVVANDRRARVCRPMNRTRISKRSRSWRPSSKHRRRRRRKMLPFMKMHCKNGLIKWKNLKRRQISWSSSLSKQRINWSRWRTKNKQAKRPSRKCRQE